MGFDLSHDLDLPTHHGPWVNLRQRCFFLFRQIWVLWFSSVLLDFYLSFYRFLIRHLSLVGLLLWNTLSERFNETPSNNWVSLRVPRSCHIAYSLFRHEVYLHIRFMKDSYLLNFLEVTWLLYSSLRPHLNYEPSLVDTILSEPSLVDTILSFWISVRFMCGYPFTELQTV